LAALAGSGDIMTGLPVPLGVRFFTLDGQGERWVSRFVGDIQYRSVVPGGFASATITLRLPRGTGTIANPDPQGFSRMVELFNRVQVVDLCTAEVAWEGRIEDPARQVEPDTWQIGALGSMVAATDIQRPVFYVDSNLDGWTSAEQIDGSGTLFTAQSGFWQTSTDDTARSLTTKYQTNYIGTSGTIIYSWRWDSHGYDQPIARFTTTHDGLGPNSAQQANFEVRVGVASNGSIDGTLFSAAEATKTNVIVTDFSDTNTRFIIIGSTYVGTAGGYQVTGSDVMQLKVRNPKVLGMRQDRFGNKLTTAASYPGDYVTVAQVVEDVVGRFLVGGWYEGGTNTPFPGSVRPQDVYIDATDTTQILHLAYPDGTTAADILNDLISQVQENAYWAIWESKWNPADPAAPWGFRFEWATWPNNWGYLASSQDGFEGQPNGDDVYNFVFYRYPDSGDANQYHVTTTWQGNEMAPELLSGAFTRAVTVNKSDPTDAGTAGALRNAYLASKKKVLNAGTLTVSRPIAFYDAGANGWSGASRLLDPHMIRPGKLVRIVDLPPRVTERDVTFGTTLPNETLNGTLFRVVATDYSSSDNTCRMELDQVTRWQLPTQISSVAGGSKTIRIQ
jgi:hypothetical protein